MTHYDRTLEDAVRAAGHQVRCAWQMAGLPLTQIAGMECLLINNTAIIVQTFVGGGWEAYTPSSTNSVDQTIRDVMLACGLPVGDPEYLARFPEAHRATADRAYQDGFQDGKNDGPEDGLFTVILRHPDWADQADNGWGGTTQRHVTAYSPDEAVKVAQAEELKASMCNDAAPEDWAKVAVFAGHLTDIGPTP